MSTDTAPISKVKQALYIGGPVLLLALWLLSSYLTNRPSEQELKLIPKIYPVKGPMRLSGSFFGVSLMKHLVYSPLLKTQLSRTQGPHLFFLYDQNKTPFREKLPPTIGVGYITHKFGPTIVYIAVPSKKMKFAFNRKNGGDIKVFVNNGSDRAMAVQIDAKKIPILPPRSMARVTLKKGTHTFISHAVGGAGKTAIIKVYLDTYDRKGPADKIQWYVLNLDNQVTYTLRSAVYRSRR
jgi:hypothetical protein